MFNGGLMMIKDDRETAAVTANNSRRKTENVCVRNI